MEDGEAITVFIVGTKESAILVQPYDNTPGLVEDRGWLLDIDVAIASIITSVSLEPCQ